MSGIVTHGDGKPRHGIGVPEEAGRYAKIRTGEATTGGIPTRTPAPKTDPLADFSAQMDQLRIMEEQIRARQQLKDLTQEVLRRHPGAVSFEMEQSTANERFIEIAGANDEKGDSIDGSEELQNELFSDSFPALGRKVKDFENLFPEGTIVRAIPKRHGAVTVSCTVADANTFTGEAASVYDSPFRLTWALEAAAKEARRSEVNAVLDRIDEMKGSLPDHVAELRITPPSRHEGYNLCSYVDHDGNDISDTRLAVLTNLAVSLTNDDLIKTDGRVEYRKNEDDGKYYHYIPLV